MRRVLIFNTLKMGQCRNSITTGEISILCLRSVPGDDREVTIPMKMYISSTGCSKVDGTFLSGESVFAAFTAESRGSDSLTGLQILKPRQTVINFKDIQSEISVNRLDVNFNLKYVLLQFNLSERQ